VDENMKVVAVHQPAHPDVLKAYGVDSMQLGKEYIIPKPFDPRLIDEVPAAVSAAAIASGVARKS